MKVNIRSHCSKGLLAHTPGIPVSLADYFLLKLLTLLQLLDPCFYFCIFAGFRCFVVEFNRKGCFPVLFHYLFLKEIVLLCLAFSVSFVSSYFYMKVPVTRKE